MVAELTRRCIEELESGDPEAHLDYVAEWVEGGGTLAELAREMSETIPTEHGHVEVEARWISRHLISKHGQDVYDARMAAARAVGAFALVDEAKMIADDPDDEIVTRDDIAKAKLRTDVRLWSAERFNRKALGQSRNDVNVNVTVNQLHIDALRARQVSATARLATGETGEIGEMAPARAILSAAIEADEPAEVAVEVIELEEVS